MMNQKRNYFVLGSIVTFFVIGGITLYAETHDDDVLEEKEAIVTTRNEFEDDLADDVVAPRVDRDDDDDSDEYDEDEDDDEEEDDDDDNDDRSRGSAVATTAVSVKSTTPAVTKTSPSPAVPMKTFTLAQVATHNTRESCFTSIAGKVYDLTSYIDMHKGGVREIMSVCGRDGSILFSSQHGGSAKPEQALSTLLIGTLVQ